MRIRLRVTLALLAATLVGGAAIAGSSSGITRADASRVVTAQPVGTPLPGTTKVRFTLVLRMHEQALAAYEKSLFDPKSSDYGHYLTPAQYGRRFGLGDRALATLERSLRAAGLPVVGVFPQRTSLTVRGTVSTIRSVFGSGLLKVTAGSRTYTIPDRAPVIPSSFGGAITAVDGLDTSMLATKDDLPAASSGALRPIDARTAYDIAPLYAKNAGLTDGRGQTIAVLSIDRFSPANYAHFSKTFGLPQTPAPKVYMLSRGDDTSSGETSLDTEVIHAMAPNAQIIDFEINFQDLAAAINTIVKNHVATIVSGSFGMCDATPVDGYIVPKGFRADVENALRAAAASGVTFFFSTGDVGAYDCQRSNAKDHNLTVHFPSDAPYTVAIGGTVLSEYDDSTYDAESGWQDIASNGGSGGGVNPYDKAPPWQQAVQFKGVSNGNRQTPDFSAAGGSGSPWWVFDGGKGGGWGQMYGTSASTPFWAASMLLVQQYMQAQKAGPLCFAAPLLYAVAQLNWKYAPIHDVTQGGNRYYNAVQGWDFATGWGSPDVYNLATAIVSYRSKYPLPSGNACGSVLP